MRAQDIICGKNELRLLGDLLGLAGEWREGQPGRSILQSEVEHHFYILPAFVRAHILAYLCIRPLNTFRYASAKQNNLNKDESTSLSPPEQLGDDHKSNTCQYRWHNLRFDTHDDHRNRKK
jgi:hypothetical protein